MLLERIKKYNIYLASQSPRRQELLKNAGIDFMITSYKDVDESYPNSLEKEEVVLYLAEKKADYYSKILLKDNRVIITADTIVWCENKILNKPKSLSEAKEMLNFLSGKKHSVITGITLLSTQKRHSFFCTTDVWFKKLKTEEINYYVDNYKPLDKAGAYGIQEWIGFIGVEKINGSYFNVVGLPIQMLYTELDKFLV